MRKRAGASCGKAPYLPRIFRNFSHKDEPSSAEPAFATPLDCCGSRHWLPHAAHLAGRNLCANRRARRRNRNFIPRMPSSCSAPRNIPGVPRPVYRARLDHAFDLFQQGLAPVVITTGGAAADPRFSEGGVGHDYLMHRGIPDSQPDRRNPGLRHSAIRGSALA